MNAASALKPLGLSSEESDLYVVLNRRGASEAKRLAAELGIKRTSVYAMLDRLCEKGFAEQRVTKNGREYLAVRPQKVRLAQEKKVAQFTALIPWLESQTSSDTGGENVRIFETRQELKQWYIGMLHEYAGRSYRIIGTQQDWYRLDPDFLEAIHKTVKDKRIRAQLLFSADTPRVFQDREPSIYRDIRYLPKAYTFRSTIDIFDDQILIVSPEQRAVAVVITNPAMMDVFDAVFRCLWEVGKGENGSKKK